MVSKSVGVIGAGAWGSGLAQAIARGGHKVQMWAREQDVVDGINNNHENKRYLPGYPLSENMTASSDIKEVERTTKIADEKTLKECMKKHNLKLIKINEER